VFPSSLRAKGVALSTCSNWLNNFIIVSNQTRTLTQNQKLTVHIKGLITPPLVQNTGFGAYTFFAVFCLLALVWTFIFVPETKGRTLEQMDDVFKDNSSEAEQARRHAIEAELLRAEGERYAVEA
jgi:hypothetical protein